MFVRLAIAVLTAVVALPAKGAISALPTPDESAGALHVRLTKSEPAKDQTVPAPTTIRLWFSLAPEMAVTTVTLADASGKSVALSRAHRTNADGAPVEADIRQALAPGRYTVEWKTSSRDGHPMKGAFSFTVRSGV